MDTNIDSVSLSYVFTLKRLQVEKRNVWTKNGKTKKDISFTRILSRGHPLKGFSRNTPCLFPKNHQCLNVSWFNSPSTVTPSVKATRNKWVLFFLSPPMFGPTHHRLGLGDQWLEWLLNNDFYEATFSGLCMKRISGCLYRDLFKSKRKEIKERFSSWRR